MNLIGEYWGFYGIKAMSFRGVAKVSNDLRNLKVFKDFRDLPRKGRFRTFKIMNKIRQGSSLFMLFNIKTAKDIKILELSKNSVTFVKNGAGVVRPE